jgi:hypothetical protein
MALLSATIGTAASLIFEVNGLQFRDNFPGTSYAVTSMFFCNLSNDPISLTLYLVPNGDEANFSNIVFTNLTIQGLDTFALDTEKVILDNGDSIWAASSDADLSVVLSIVRVA